MALGSRYLTSELQKLSEGNTKFSDHFGRLPYISKDYRRRSGNIRRCFYHTPTGSVQLKGQTLGHLYRHGENYRYFTLYPIINNYSPKWKWLAVDIYRAAKRRG